MHYFSDLSDKVLYMFRTGPLSIIRIMSTLYTPIGICHASSVAVCWHAQLWQRQQTANWTSMTNTYSVFDFCISMHHHIRVLLGPAWCKLFSAVFIRRTVEQVNLHVHLPVPTACTFYISPEDGCVLHPKHVEQIV